jgi:hypothetical protein
MANFVNIWGKLLILPALFFLLLISSTGESTGIDIHSSTDSSLIGIKPNVGYLRYKNNVLDTIFTAKKLFIEVFLDKQKVLIRKNTGEVDTLLCSTGTEFLEKGQKTKSGIFIVRSKVKELVSKQFNNTKCLHWVGFSFGIGFHALEKKNYYWNLGKRPSSHGCIRLSQEDAKKMFEYADLGTPVFVHGKDYARVLSFIDDEDPSDTLYSKRQTYQVLKDRLRNLYSGRYFFKKYPRIVTDIKYVGHEGFDVGELQYVPSTQNIPLFYYSDQAFCTVKDKTDFMVSSGLYRKYFQSDTVINN